MDTATFNITSCAQFKQRVEAGVREGRARYGRHLAWASVIGDLSNMYTELRHTAIERAVEWESRLPGKKRVADRVAVHRRRREARLERCYGAGWVEVKTAGIRQP